MPARVPVVPVVSGDSRPVAFAVVLTIGGLVGSGSGWYSARGSAGYLDLENKWEKAEIAKHIL